ncbi:hypothetical protein [Parasitella parasitica]|uniref:Uncharacterized protein n=1 Tax=Parasitella parasitica TaxID=35722 RepID=A0A0B7MXF9_9FUNG|nr:hypothetical protein [Parasitella parasitica]
MYLSLQNPNPICLIQDINGLRIPFLKVRPIRPVSPCLSKVSLRDSQATMEAEMLDILRKRAIEETSGLGFQSYLFAVPKKNAALRPVLNLLRSWAAFRINTIKQVSSLVKRNDVMVSVDLQQAEDIVRSVPGNSKLGLHLQLNADDPFHSFAQSSGFAARGLPPAVPAEGSPSTFSLLHREGHGHIFGNPSREAEHWLTSYGQEPSAILCQTRLERSCHSLVQGQAEYFMVEVFTDAFLHGYGIVWDHNTVSGSWPCSLQHASINYLELLTTILNVIRLPPLQGKVLRIYSNNTTSSAYVKRFGGTRSDFLMDLSVQIWNHCFDTASSVSLLDLGSKRNRDRCSIRSVAPCQGSISVSPLESDVEISAQGEVGALSGGGHRTRLAECNMASTPATARGVSTSPSPSSGRSVSM